MDRDLDELAYVISGLVNDQDYVVRVAGVNYYGAGEYSSVTATASGAVPGKPTGLETLLDGVNVTLVWDLPDVQAHEAVVQWKLPDESWDDALSQTAVHPFGVPILLK